MIPMNDEPVLFDDAELTNEDDTDVDVGDYDPMDEVEEAEELDGDDIDADVEEVDGVDLDMDDTV